MPSNDYRHLPRMLHQGVLVLLACLAAEAPAMPATRLVTITEGTNFAVTFAPDGTAVIDVQGALWRLRPGQQRGEPLTDGRGDDRLPRFSPDGRQVVFQSFRTGDFDLWTMPATGGAPRALTGGPHDDREPAWFPDGRRVAFTSDRNGNLDIWQVATGSGVATPLTTDPADDYWPAVSPDGSRLAFVSDRGGLPGVYVQDLPAAGGGARLLTAGKAGRPVAPSWSPDGRRLAFVRAAEQIGFPSITRYEIVELEVASGSSRVLTVADDDVFPFPPAWLPEGGLAWTADGGLRVGRPDGSVAPRDFRLELPVARPAYRRRAWLPASGPQAVLGIVEPVTAPDGGVVFSALGDLWWRRPSGRLDRLTDDAAVERDPAFSRDGSLLAFVSDREGSMQVWLRDLATGQDRQLTRMPRGVRYPAFAPNGRFLAFQQAGPRGNQDFTLHRADLAGDSSVTPIKAPPLWPGRMGFSADGHLLVAVLTSTSARYREGRNVLRVIDPLTGTGTRVALPDGRTADTGFAVAPDGSRMALLIDGELWIQPLAADGSARGPPVRRLKGLADYPSFSTDGRQLTWLADGGLLTANVLRGRPRRLPVALDWAPAAGTGALLIRAGRLFDGAGPGYRRNVDILVAGDRIVAVAENLAPPSGAQVLDARDSTVLPGLIDNHAHHQGHDGAWVGEAWLAFGVTSVVEPGGLPRESRELYESWTSGRRGGPRLFFAGPQLDGRARFFPFASHVSTDRRLRQELARAQRLGYSLLKTYTRMPVSREAQAIRAGHRLGLPVSSHELWPALALGGDRVEHLRGTSRLGWSPKQSDSLRLYSDALGILGNSGATLVPTVVVGGGFLDVLLRHPDLDALPQYARFYGEGDRRALRGLANLAVRKRDLFDTGLRNAQQALRDLSASGTRLVAGTDAPIFPYGLSLLAELRAFRDAGLSGEAVLRAATSEGAAAVSAGAQLGRIEPGFLADLIVVNGDPLTDPLELARLELVISNGRPVSGSRCACYPAGRPPDSRDSSE